MDFDFRGQTKELAKKEDKENFGKNEKKAIDRKKGEGVCNAIDFII